MPQSLALGFTNESPGDAISPKSPVRALTTYRLAPALSLGLAPTTGKRDRAGDDDKLLREAGLVETSRCLDVCARDACSAESRNWNTCNSPRRPWKFRESGSRSAPRTAATCR